MKKLSLNIISITILAILLFMPGCKKDNVINYPATVTDIDGNVYHTVKIGTQVWMTENLKVTHYRNGEYILNILDGLIWDYLSTGAYCIYDHTPSNAAIYGNLYNWHAVNDHRKLAPEGWHIPTDDEWRTLNSYLGEEIASGKLKEADTTHWSYPNVGATNETGFTALPAGIRSASYIGFTNLRSNTYWWAASISNSGSALAWGAVNNKSTLTRKEWYPTFGFSVRCIMD
jgi:uncharacterized protein (TIGR02145 family)